MYRQHTLLFTTCTLLASVTVGSILVALHIYHAHSPTTPLAAPKNVVTKTLSKPSTTVLTPHTYTSTAAPNEPSYISLPTIGARGFIQKVGVDQYGQMAAPTNVHLAGWYVNSLLPGQAGLSIIDGHIDGYTHNQGLFGQLNKLQPGDVFTITLGNGSHRSYTVKNIQLVDAANVPSVLFAHDPSIASQLNLITCGGDYDGVSHTYDKRTIIISTLIL
jgi:LPXTG-site transpeptidase (sortase) family protein